VAGGPGNFGQGQINGRNVTIFRGPRGIWWGGGVATLVGLGVLSDLLIDNQYLPADGYVVLAQPLCSGITAEGCALNWQDVPTEDGSAIPQCVQFCPRPGAPRLSRRAVASPQVAQTVGGAATAGASTQPQQAADAMARGCQMAIYSEASYGGVSSDVTADQPQLTEAGWDKEISSLKINSGNWDFYSEPNYGGQMVRLEPGQYGDLEAWDKQISSFMCAQTQ
jgi:hypothetical protein